MDPIFIICLLSNLVNSGEVYKYLESKVGEVVGGSRLLLLYANPEGSERSPRGA